MAPGRALQVIPRPSKQQLAWLELEIGTFFHFNMYTFVSGPSPMDRHEDCGHYFNGGLKTMPPPSTFNPTTSGRFVDNWMNASRAFGAKYALLVAKHCSGFVTYPTNATFDDGSLYGYGVQQSGWQRDLMRDFTESAREYGVAPGAYYSLDSNFYLSVNDGNVTEGTAQGQRPVTQDEYYRVVMQQVRDLWGGYGPLAEIWFDGRHPFCQNDTFRAEIKALTAELQPDAVLQQGPSPVNAARKGAGESGDVNDPNWYDRDGNFIPAEGIGCAVGDGSSRQWFWHPDHDEHAAAKPLSLFWEEYHKSVGLGSNYLIGFTADRRGLIPENDVAKVTAFGKLVRECYGSSIAKTASPVTLKSQEETVNVSLSTPTAMDRLWVMEDLTTGQRIRKWTLTVVYQTGAETGVKEDQRGTTETVSISGSSIGRKRIIRLDKTYQAVSVALKVTDAYAFPVPIRQVALFAPCNDPK